MHEPRSLRLNGTCYHDTIPLHTTSADQVVTVSIKVDFLHRIMKNVKHDDVVTMKVENDDELIIVRLVAM